MSELSPKSRAFVDAARGAGPTTEARARIRAGLDARIAAAAAAALVHESNASAAGTKVAAGAKITAGAKGAGLGIVIKVSVASVIVGAMGVGAVAVVRTPVETRAAGATVTTSSSARVNAPTELPSEVDRTPQAEASATAVSATSPTVVATSSPVTSPSVASTSSVVAAPRVVSPRVAARPSASKPSEPAPEPVSAPETPASASIASEVALLREAQSALEAGDAARSLRAVDALTQRHSDGVLREERMVIRVLALCAAGRVQEAHAEGRRFLAEMPRSVLADRVRASCVDQRSSSDER
ncbi:Hypothetical protein A7982_04575 [Minicystis rosea]|nr:Hypothetical protein A7982_04575 [Minicystis rosea]